ncbi:MAG: hypothetical protein PHC69_10210 [Ruminiclostridium sp.]|nr:hypothetical protein [Ruminiclostridium sp.]
MEDKIFDLITQLHTDMTEQFKAVRSDITGMKAEISGIKGDITGMKAEISGIKGDITGIKSEVSGIKDDIKGLNRDVIRIENVHGDKLDALFDGYRQLADGQEEIKSQLVTLTEKVDSHDLEIVGIRSELVQQS